MNHQRAPSISANAWNIIQLGLFHLTRPAHAVGSNRKSVRLITQTLQKMQPRIGQGQLESIAAGHMEKLSARIAVYAL